MTSVNYWPLADREKLHRLKKIMALGKIPIMRRRMGKE